MGAFCSRGLLDGAIGSWWAHLQKRARIATGEISAVITASDTVLLRRLVMRRRPRKAQRRRGGGSQRSSWNSWNRRYVSAMSARDGGRQIDAISGQWSVVGSDRLINFWRVVLHISDAIMYAGASGWGGGRAYIGA
jgi:hypothetical protein